MVIVGKPSTDIVSCNVVWPPPVDICPHTAATLFSQYWCPLGPFTFIDVGKVNFSLQRLLKECESKTKDNLKKDQSTTNGRAKSKDSVKEDIPGTGNEAINKANHVEIISDQQEFNGPSKRQRTGSESEWLCLGRMSLHVKEKT